MRLVYLSDGGAEYSQEEVNARAITTYENGEGVMRWRTADEGSPDGGLVLEELERGEVIEVQTSIVRVGREEGPPTVRRAATGRLDVSVRNVGIEEQYADSGLV